MYSKSQVTKNVNIHLLIKSGYKYFKVNAKQLIIFSAIMTLISFLLNMCGTLGLYALLITGSLGIFLIPFVYAIWNKYCLNIVSDIRPTIENTRIILSHPIRIWTTYILFGLVTILGFMLLIIPGIMLFLTFAQCQYAIIDEKNNISDSFTFSDKITKGHRRTIFFIYLIPTLIQVIFPFVISQSILTADHNLRIFLWALLIFISGLNTILIIPLSGIVYAILYKNLKRRFLKYTFHTSVSSI